MTTQPPEVTVVLGVGNELMTDDGVGMAVARALADEDLGPQVRVVEGGTGGLDLVFELEGAARAILVDAVDSGAEPGSVRAFTPEEARICARSTLASLHQIGLEDVLEIGELVGIRPEITIVGIQPAQVGPGMRLSGAVQSAVPVAVERVKQLLAAPAGR